MTTQLCKYRQLLQTSYNKIIHHIHTNNNNNNIHSTHFFIRRFASKKSNPVPISSAEALAQARAEQEATERAILKSKERYLYSWGSGTYGGLGQGNYNDQSIVLPISSMKDKAVKHIACGWTKNIAVLNDGSVYEWGYKPFLRSLASAAKWKKRIPKLFPKIQNINLGRITYSNAVTTPTKINGFGSEESITNETNTNKTNTNQKSIQQQQQQNQRPVLRAVSASCGGDFQAILTDTGQVYTYGQGFYGQLGHDSDIRNTLLYKPKHVDFLSNLKITQVSAGFAHLMCLSSDGRLYVCGQTNKGALGIYTIHDRNGEGKRLFLPHLVNQSDEEYANKDEPFIGDIIGISAGMKHSLILNNKGEVYSCGTNTFGQLGNGTFNSSNIFQRVAIGEKIIKISAGQHHNLALSENNNIYAWGLSKQGQCYKLDGMNEKNTNPAITNVTSKYNAESFATIPTPQIVKLPNSLNINALGKINDIVAGFYDSAIIYNSGAMIMFGGLFDLDGFKLPHRVTPNLNVSNIAFGMAHAIITARSATPQVIPTIKNK